MTVKVCKACNGSGSERGLVQSVCLWLIDGYWTDPVDCQNCGGTGLPQIPSRPAPPQGFCGLGQRLSWEDDLQ